LLFVTISAGGTRVATAGQPAPGAPLHTEVKVWDAAAGRPLFQFDEPNLRVTRLALSPEGNRLALAGQLITPTEEAQASWSKPVVRVYDVGTAKVVREFVGSRAVEGRDEPFHALGFSANGARLAAAGSARTVLLWDLSAAQPVVTRDGPKDAMDLTFSPNGRRLAIASQRQVKLLDVASGHEVLTLLGRKHLLPDTHAFNPRVRFSPDGQRLVAICHDQISPLAVWSVKKKADGAARLRVADRQATVAHLRLAKLYAGNPKKHAAFLFHLKHLKGVQLATPQEYAVRGLLLARAGQLDVAEPDLARARGVAWDDAPTLFKVGEAFAARGRWKQAAPYFDRYFALGRGSGWSDSRVPCLKLYLNDRAAYRRCCRQLLERHGKSTDANTILNILIWGPLLEDGAADPHLLVSMADHWLKGTEKHPLRQCMVEAKGMAEYRAGRFEQAVAWLRKAEPMARYHYQKAGIFFFLSMACQRLNRGDEARAAYQQGLRHMEIYFGSRDEYRPGKGRWYEWAWCQVLRSEAEAVLKNARGRDKPKK
jgi:tetratricopeptide (TPR) repeat protein